MDLWSVLLSTNIWKSRKHSREHCHFVFGSLCLWHEKDCRVAEVSITSQANLFLLFTKKEQTNMAAPRGTKIQSKKSTCCMNIDRTTIWNLLIEIFARFLTFSGPIVSSMIPQQLCFNLHHMSPWNLHRVYRGCLYTHGFHIVTFS